MAMRYRTKPVEVIAVQWKGNNVREVTGLCPDAQMRGPRGLFLLSGERGIPVPKGHWIVRRLDGDGYRVVDPDVFKERYEFVPRNERS